MWSRQFNDESEEGYEARDDVADGDPQGEARVSPCLWTHLIQLDKDVVAHEGHEGEGREDGELVEEGKPDAGGARLLVPLQVLHHHQ